MRQRGRRRGAGGCVPEGVCHSPTGGGAGRMRQRGHPRGCARLGAGVVPLLGTAACPERPPMWRGVPGCVPEGYIGCRPFLCKKVLLLGTAACPGGLQGVCRRGISDVVPVVLLLGGGGGRRVLLSRRRCRLVVYIGAIAVGLVASREKSRREGWERLRVVWWLPEVVFSHYCQTRPQPPLSPGTPHSPNPPSGPLPPPPPILLHFGTLVNSATLIRRHRTRHLIRVCIVCLNYRKLRVEGQSTCHYNDFFFIVPNVGIKGLSVLQRKLFFLFHVCFLANVLSEWESILQGMNVLTFLSG